MKIFAIVSEVVLVLGPASAADKAGLYMIGGGVGGVGCPEFLNAMQTRLKGGLNTPAGAEEISNFVNYVEGLRTGFNSENRGGILDIFAALENRPVGASTPYMRWSFGANSIREKGLAPLS
jgi:hypothetical protein